MKGCFLKQHERKNNKGKLNIKKISAFDALVTALFQNLKLKYKIGKCYFYRSIKEFFLARPNMYYLIFLLLFF